MVRIVQAVGETSWSETSKVRIVQAVGETSIGRNVQGESTRAWANRPGGETSSGRNVLLPTVICNQLSPLPHGRRSQLAAGVVNTIPAAGRNAGVAGAVFSNTRWDTSGNACRKIFQFWNTRNHLWFLIVDVLVYKKMPGNIVSCSKCLLGSEKIEHGHFT